MPPKIIIAAPPKRNKGLSCTIPLASIGAKRSPIHTNVIPILYNHSDNLSILPITLLTCKTFIEVIVPLSYNIDIAT
jgi:hypothetical protein